MENRDQNWENSRMNRSTRWTLILGILSTAPGVIGCGVEKKENGPSPSATVGTNQPDEKGAGNAGEPGSPGGGRRGMGRFGGPPQPGQIYSSFIQERLNLTPEQKKDLEQIQKDVDQSLGKILSADQKNKLKEMQQGFGPGGPPGFGGPPPDGPPGFGGPPDGPNGPGNDRPGPN